MTDPNLLNEPRGLRGGELPLEVVGNMVLFVKDEEYFIAANISIRSCLLPPRGRGGVAWLVGVTSWIGHDWLKTFHVAVRPNSSRAQQWKPSRRVLKLLKYYISYNVSLLLACFEVWRQSGMCVSIKIICRVANSTTTSLYVKSSNQKAYDNISTKIATCIICV